MTLHNLDAIHGDETYVEDERDISDEVLEKMADLDSDLMVDLIPEHHEQWIDLLVACRGKKKNQKLVALDAFIAALEERVEAHVRGES